MSQSPPSDHPPPGSTSPIASAGNVTGLSSTRRAIRVSLACVQCRSRHLRCDATTPICARCRADGSQCTYLKSRRGGRARATVPAADAISALLMGEQQQRQQQQQSQTQMPPQARPPQSHQRGSSSSISSPSMMRSPTNGSVVISPAGCGGFTPNSLPIPLDPSIERVPSLVSDQSQSASSSGSSLGSDEHIAGAQYGEGKRLPLIDLYYKFFHMAQPCALPLHFLRLRISSCNSSRSNSTGSLDSGSVESQAQPHGMRLLLLVMQFIGSLYAPSIPSAPLEELVKAVLAESPRPPSGFEVQALILYSMAVYWCGDTQRSHELLAMATSQALALGMNFKEFAANNSGGDPVLAESWRRTWWQLYLTDAHVASSLHETTFGTSQRDVPVTVELPCEESEYNSGNIPTPKTLNDYDNREFALDEDASFSSFAYLIGLIRTLDHIIIGIPRTSEENIKTMCTNVDASIAAWVSLLSKSKRKLFREDGTVDALLYKANTLIQAYTVDIHRSLSTLSYSPIESISSCSPPPPPERLAPIYYRDAPLHTAKIMRAIERMTDLLTMPVRIGVLTPFTSCMVANVTIAHLSACRFALRDQPELLKVARERIRVAMGALEIFAEVWPKGKEVVVEVKTIARELLSLGPSSTTAAAAVSCTSSSSLPSGIPTGRADSSMVSPSAGTIATTSSAAGIHPVKSTTAAAAMPPGLLQVGGLDAMHTDLQADIAAQIANDETAVQADYFTGLHHASSVGGYFGYPTATAASAIGAGAGSGLALGLLCDDLSVAGDFSFDMSSTHF